MHNWYSTYSLTLMCALTLNTIDFNVKMADVQKNLVSDAAWIFIVMDVDAGKSILNGLSLCYKSINKTELVIHM